MLYRRTKRDGNVNGMNYTVNAVIPESHKYEKIQKSRADIIINGNKSKEEIIEEIEKHIRKWNDI
jgi:thymidylate kinase